MHLVAHVGQLFATLWDSQSWPVVIKPGIEPLLQNTSLNVNSEEATPGCWPFWQSCNEKAISQTGQ
jgi:hypothetical protein